MLQKTIYIFFTIFSTFFILSSILYFFEIPPTMYIIYIMYVIVMTILYMILPSNPINIFEI